MQKFFFDMKDGVPHRDTVGIEFKTNAEAIGHCKEIAQYFRDESSATIKTSRYRWSIRLGGRFTGSLFTGIHHLEDPQPSVE